MNEMLMLCVDPSTGVVLSVVDRESGEALGSVTLSESEAESIAAGGSLTIDSSSGPVSLALELIPDVDDDEDEAEVDPEFDGEVSNRVTCGDDSDSDEEIEIELGEADIGEFMATKPWMGAIVCPTAWEGRMPSDEMPSNDLELEFVHGYRAHDARQNLYILPSGEILYSSAALGIVMNLKTRTQRYFTGHTDDIVCVAYHPGRHIVATGQMGKHPRICVWDPDSMTQLACLSGFLQRQVTYVDFNGAGDKVLGVGMDNDHTIAVYDWQRNRLLAKGSGDKSTVFCASFNPNNDSQIVCCGIKHIKFGTLDAGNIKMKRGIFGSKGELQSILGFGWLKNYAISGTANGDVYVWNGNNLVKAKKRVHDGPVFSVSVSDEYVVTGGRDGSVRVFDHRLNDVATVQLSSAVRAVAIDGDRLIVGTLTGIFETSVSDSSVNPIINAHSDELWGIALHPFDDVFVSCSDEGLLKVWSVQDRSLIRAVDCNGIARRCGYHPFDNVIAVGFKDGSIALFDADSMTETFRNQRHKQGISQIKFSPDGSMLAVGSHDNTVSIWSYTGGSLEFASLCRGHSSYITHLDFSTDGAFLQTNSGDYELLFWDVLTGQQQTSASGMRDVEWASWTCTLGWPVQGIWDVEQKGTDINAVEKAHSLDVIATAENSGRIRLMSYPCVGGGFDHRGRIRSRPAHKEFRGHSSFVTNLCWSADDSHVFSTGGLDRSIFQWAVV